MPYDGPQIVEKEPSNIAQPLQEPTKLQFFLPHSHPMCQKVKNMLKFLGNCTLTQGKPLTPGRTWVSNSKTCTKTHQNNTHEEIKFSPTRGIWSSKFHNKMEAKRREERSPPTRKNKTTQAHITRKS